MLGRMTRFRLPTRESISASAKPKPIAAEANKLPHLRRSWSGSRRWPLYGCFESQHPGPQLLRRLNQCVLASEIDRGPRVPYRFPELSVPVIGLKRHYYVGLGVLVIDAVGVAICAESCQPPQVEYVIFTQLPSSLVSRPTASPEKQ
jgi:hypothetical protein